MRWVFENIRTDFINGLGGRKGKARTPFPPASPKSGSEKDDFKFFGSLLAELRALLGLAANSFLIFSYNIS